MVSMACWTFQRLERGCVSGGFLNGTWSLVDLLVDGGVFSETAKFTLNGDAGWVMRTGVDGVERCAALRIGVVMIIVEIAGTVIIPATGGNDKSRWIDRVHKIGQCKLGILAIHDLTPAFVVDNPGHDARIAAVLANKQFELTLELLLLFGVGQDCLCCAIVEGTALGRSE